MIKSLWIFSLSFLGVFIIDQNIKLLFLEGFNYFSHCISLVLTLNKGIAFSMLSFFGQYLKYIQVVLILSVLIYLVFKRDIFRKYALPLGILLGAGCSNIYDRFIHGGVVDYVYWHCGFDFAIFNFADVMIDLSVIMILYIAFKSSKVVS